MTTDLQNLDSLWLFGYIGIYQLTGKILDNKTKARYEARAQIIKALAHPSRLFIVEQLAQGKQCVNELTEMIGVDASTVSKHLSILKNSVLVKDEKVGTSVYYELVTPCILNFFGCVENVMKSNAERHLDLIEQ